MGEAKRRGTFEQRVEQAKTRPAKKGRIAPRWPSGGSFMSRLMALVTSGGLFSTISARRRR